MNVPYQPNYTDHPKIIEAGHFYLSKGPTLWSVVGMEIAKNVAQIHDQIMLMIDDMHPRADVSPVEAAMPLIPGFQPDVDVTVLESDMQTYALEFLERLKTLSKKKRAKQSKSGAWFSGEFPLTDKQGEPLCVLLDAGLSLYKQELGFSHALNVLPDFYEQEQRNLMRLLKKIMPDFELASILYDIHGQCHTVVDQNGSKELFIPPASVTEEVSIPY